MKVSWLVNTDPQPQEAASRRLLRASHLRS